MSRRTSTDLARGRRRDVFALVTALVVHAALLVYVTYTPTKRMFVVDQSKPIAIDLVEPKPKAHEDVAPPPQPEPQPTRAPTTPTQPTKPTTTTPPEPPQQPTPPQPEPETTAPKTTTPTTQPDSDQQSVVRLKKGDGAIGRVLGTGGELAASTATLENSLELRADGPMSDGKRAALNAKRHLETDMSDDAVTAGLADDYFRELKNRVETNWRPAMKDLNDGGAVVTQVGMMKALVDDDGRAAWGEMWQAYLDLAKQYSNGVQPRLEPPRVERLRELMRSRKRPFQYHAITEAILTQGPDGKVLTIEIPLSSGHPGIDDEVRDAISTAVSAMVDPPPARIHHGRPFSSTWRMRATWTMVPPTAFLTGAGFDITSKGFTVDVPFEITLKTYVMLLHTDAHAHTDAEAAEK